MAVTLVGSVGTGHNESLTSATSIAATRSGIVAGNTIVVAVTCENTQTITNVSDGTTTNTTPDITFNGTTVGQRLAFYSFTNHTGGSFTFTANFSASVAFRSIVIVELTPSVFEGSSSGQGTSAAPSSGNISPTPTVDGEYIIGYVLGANQPAFASPFSDLFSDTVNAGDTEGLAQATAGAVAATWTMTSGAWGAIAASYKSTVVVSAAITGTITSSVTENDIVAGGNTIIITLTGDTWILP